MKVASAQVPRKFGAQMTSTCPELKPLRGHEENVSSLCETQSQGKNTGCVGGRVDICLIEYLQLSSSSFSAASGSEPQPQAAGPFAARPPPRQPKPFHYRYL
jgi:hypothetical protein